MTKKIELQKEETQKVELPKEEIKKPLDEKRLENLAKARKRAMEVRQEKAKMKQDLKLAEKLDFEKQHKEAREKIEASVSKPVKKLPVKKLQNKNETSEEDEEEIVEIKKIKKPKKKIVKYVEASSEDEISQERTTRQLPCKDEPDEEFMKLYRSVFN